MDCRTSTVMTIFKPIDVQNIFIEVVQLGSAIIELPPSLHIGSHLKKARSQQNELRFSTVLN